MLGHVIIKPEVRDCEWCKTGVLALSRTNALQYGFPERRFREVHGDPKHSSFPTEESYTEHQAGLGSSRTGWDNNNVRWSLLGLGELCCEFLDRFNKGPDPKMVAPAKWNDIRRFISFQKAERYLREGVVPIMHSGSGPFNLCSHEVIEEEVSGHVSDAWATE
jgi:hypothetical protein